MKKQKIAALSAILLGSAVLSSGISFAADGGELTTNGIIEFTTNTSTTDPVDPLDPDPSDPITPEDPTGPTPGGTAGPLSIDFASSLSFGSQKISSKTETYFAGAQKYKDSAGADKEGPNFVQVTDNRGVETGWTLKVKQNGQFKTSADKELTGAKITFKNGNVVTNSQSPKPANVSSTIVLATDASESLVMSAKNGQGAGTHLMDWGNSVDTAKNSISIEVPGSTTKYASKYTTTFTWILSDTPGN
ncbi:MAG: WxL domain-containing protein [Streptococcaceae bacterium]|jgi:hypothetical protein|nr:WxL domain-containing protein [Streptococcaceae bacterium]